MHTLLGEDGNKCNWENNKISGFIERHCHSTSTYIFKMECMKKRHCEELSSGSGDENDFQQYVLRTKYVYGHNS